MIAVKSIVIIIQCIIVGMYWYRHFIVYRPRISRLQKLWIYIASYTYCVAPGRFLSWILISYYIDHRTLKKVMLWQSYQPLDIVLPLAIATLLARGLSKYASKQPVMSERKVYGFVGFSMLIYIGVTYLIIFRSSRTIEEDRMFLLSIFSLIVGMFIVFSRYYIQRAWHHVVLSYTDTTVDLNKIRQIISKKQAMMIGMVNDLREALPMPREQIEDNIQEIKRQAFIKIGFSDDDVLNALIFRYYIECLERKVDFTTRVSPDLQIHSAARAGRTYQFIEAWLEYCLHIDAKQIERVNMELIRIEERIQIRSQVYGEFRALKQERLNLMTWKTQIESDIAQMNRLEIGISPISIEIETYI